MQGGLVLNQGGTEGRGLTWCFWSEKKCRERPMEPKLEKLTAREGKRTFGLGNRGVREKRKK